MDFSLTPEQALVQDDARRVAQALAPDASRRRAEGETPLAAMQALAALGLLGVNISKELGGRQAGVVAYAAAVREVAAVDASLAVTMAVTNMVGEVLCQFGTTEQQEHYVPMLTSAQALGGAFALSEPQSGSDAASLQTRAVREGDDWVINGQKMWITTGDDAVVVVVWARTSDEGAAHRGISCFLVPGDAPGLVAGKPEKKMGLSGSHTVALTLDNVRVPADALLSAEGDGFKIAMTALDGGRIGIASQATGIAAGGIAAFKDLLPEGTASQVGDGVNFDLADCETELEAAWLMALRAAFLKEAKLPFSRPAAMAKVLASENSNTILRRLHDGAAALGFGQPAALAERLHDARVTQIYEGTSEVQRVVIARDILR